LVGTAGCKPNKLTAQSIALGIVMVTVRPERAKALHHVLGLLPLQGVDSPIEPIPQGVALG